MDFNQLKTNIFQENIWQERELSRDSSEGHLLSYECKNKRVVSKWDGHFVPVQNVYVAIKFFKQYMEKLTIFTHIIQGIIIPIAKCFFPYTNTHCRLQ